MLSRFFVNRPIFAWVIAIVIMLAGALASITLPVAVPEYRSASDSHLGAVSRCQCRDGGANRDADYRREHDRS